MTGATDLFFGLVLALLAVVTFLFVMFSVLEKWGSWQYKRRVKKARAWVFPIFDAQAKEIIDSIHRTGFSPGEARERILALREELSANLSWSTDILEFKKKGAPLLLMYPDNGVPYVLLGISDLTDEVKLHEGSVLGHIPWPKTERAMLSETECAALTVCYLNLDQLTAYNYCDRLVYEIPAAETDEAPKTDIPEKGPC